MQGTRPTMSTTGKENNKKTNNTGGGGYKGAKKFVGGNANLQGKIFEINTREAVHQFTDTRLLIMWVKNTPMVVISGIW
jgi:hypothetical protein